MADFGFKIGIVGESEYRKNLKDIQQNMKLLGSEMAIVASEFDKNDKSMVASAARYDVLSKQIDEQKK